MMLHLVTVKLPQKTQFFHQETKKKTTFINQKHDYASYYMNFVNQKTK